MTRPAAAGPLEEIRAARAQFPASPATTEDRVVYAKRPFAGPEQVLEYLGRSTHRVAHSNGRILSLDDGRVRFRWKDYAAGCVRIRHFGLLANRTRTAKLAQCRQVPAQRAAPATRPVESVHALMLRLAGIDIDRCPVCQQRRVHVTSGPAQSLTRLLHTRYDYPSPPPTPRRGPLVGPSGQP